METTMPNLNDIMDWEAGEMPEDREAEFFQSLIDNGMAWIFQGMYGRRAMELIRAGVCTMKAGQSD